MSHLTVEYAMSNRTTDYYKVSAGKKGGEPVTVRVGVHGVYSCLTCRATGCVHADAAEDYARTNPVNERFEPKV